jgi:hypothetical protein
MGSNPPKTGALYYWAHHKNHVHPSNWKKKLQEKPGNIYRKGPHS